MIESEKKISKKSGMPPGTLIHVGTRKTEKVRISVMEYNSSEITEKECKAVEECITSKKDETVCWINVDGLHQPDIISSIGKQFGLHSLLLEDVLNTSHRPKSEEFDDHLFMAFKMIGINKKGDSLEFEQVSLVLGNDWLISFQEKQGDIFDPLRKTLRESKGNIRHKGADYLLYRLIDTVVDNYFFVTEHISETIEIFEEKILQSPNDGALSEIQKLKKQIINFRKAVNPLREITAALQKDNPLIKEGTSRYLRDVYEHIIHVIESLETQRDNLASLTELYHSGLSNRMNQVMQVLTIIATIFIPLTFIAGIYGMNFDNMPELHWKYGYFGVWGIMVLLIIIMIIYFRKKRWL